MVLLADSLFVQACIWVTQTFVSILALVSAVMQHRMLREAQKAMTPWMNGQPIYAPISSNASSQGVPILYSGEWRKSTIRLTFDALLHQTQGCLCDLVSEVEDTMK